MISRITSLPLNTEQSQWNTSKPRTNTEMDSTNKPEENTSIPNGVTEISIPLRKKLLNTFVRKDRSGTHHLDLNRGEFTFHIATGDDENNYAHSIILGGLNQNLGKNKNKAAKKDDKNRENVIKIDADVPYIREDTSALLILVAVLVCMLILYYYCSCCIFIYYLKSQFCFDIDLYKKPDTCCPPGERRFSC
ncbi:hypothetical protein M8J76_006805 [Diaphorina citri]|nr:hypothetical protein M8J76_006805 [Diaphorina citri]